MFNTAHTPLGRHERAAKLAALAHVTARPRGAVTDKRIYLGGIDVAVPTPTTLLHNLLAVHAAAVGKSARPPATTRPALTSTSSLQLRRQHDPTWRPCDHARRPRRSCRPGPLTWVQRHRLQVEHVAPLLAVDQLTGEQELTSPRVRHFPAIPYLSRTYIATCPVDCPGARVSSRS